LIVYNYIKIDRFQIQIINYSKLFEINLQILSSIN